MPPFKQDDLGFLDGVDERSIMSWHLSGNFYPPLPQGYIDPAIEARDACLDGDFDRLIDLPADLNPMPRQAQQSEDGSWQVVAIHLIEILRLELPRIVWAELEDEQRHSRVWEDDDSDDDN